MTIFPTAPWEEAWKPDRAQKAKVVPKEASSKCRGTSMSHSCRPWYTRQYFSLIHCFLHISQVNTFLGEEPEIKLPRIIENAREFQKNIYFCFIDCAKAFDCVDHNKLWKILKEMGIPDHHTCLLRNLYAGQEATGRTGHGTRDWFQIGKGVREGYIVSPCLFNLYAE